MIRKLSGLVLVGVASSAMAYYAPVEVANQSVVTSGEIEQTTLPTHNRLDLLNQVSELQGQVQTLNGRLEEQAHQISQLTDQLQRFYKDLDMRLQHAQGGDAQAATPATTEVDTADAKAYNQAFQLLQQRNYRQASQLLTDFTHQYPASQYLANAYYWLGQLYLMQGDAAQAEVMLSQVVNQFPQHQKTPDALLKLSKIATERQDIAHAKQLLHQLQSQFPNSPAAQVAQVQLRQLG